MCVCVCVRESEHVCVCVCVFVFVCGLVHGQGNLAFSVMDMACRKAIASFTCFP